MPYPEIREGASFLEATSTSAQELLSKAGTTVDRLNELLSPDNLTTAGDLLKNLQTLSGSFAKQDSSIQSALSELPAAIEQFKQTFVRLNGLSDRLGLIAAELGPQDAESRRMLAGKDKGDLAKAVSEAQAAMAKLNGASGQLNKILTDNSGSIRRFTESGLSELGLAVHELRELIVNLNIIATKLERDPAGFVFDGKNGYRPK